MRYVPKRNGKALITGIVLLLFSVLITALSREFNEYAPFVNIGAFIILIAALYITIRFAISVYTYEIDGANFNIYKTTGKRTQTLASLSMETGIGVAVYPKTGEDKRAFTEKFGKTDLRTNYCMNFMAVKYVYVTEFNGKKHELLIEINDEFAEALDVTVRNLKKRSENSQNQ